MKERKKTKKGEIRKVIELPEPVLMNLGELAKNNRMTVKPFIESILIQYTCDNPVNPKPHSTIN